MAVFDNMQGLPPTGAQAGPAQDAPDGVTLAKAVNMLGAAASLALVVGVGIWGYRLLVRDVSGVPVVRALEGPMRVAPADPGGTFADNQGLAVNAVAAQGIAEPPAERLVLAPRPVELTGEDAPMPQIAPVRAVAVPAPRQIRPQSPARAEPPERASDAVAVQALIAELIADEADESAGAEAALAPVVPAAPQRPARVSLAAVSVPRAAIPGAPGLAQSLRPRPRPAVAAAPESVAAAAPGSGGGPDTRLDGWLDVAPDAVPVGTRLAQLGAYDSPETARAEWARLNARFEAYLDGKQRVIQQASSGGRIFYRLRAMGFDDLSDARRFCSALISENADCIPVTVR